MLKAHKLNLLGLKCPIPVLRANKKIKTYKKDSVVEILVDDPSAPNDFKILCNTHNYKIIAITKNKKFTTIMIKR